MSNVSGNVEVGGAFIPFEIAEAMNLPIRRMPLTTVGAGTWLKEHIAGGMIFRTGPVGGYTDTSPSAADIIAAMGGSDKWPVGSTKFLWFVNGVAQVLTTAAGANVTLAGTTTLIASATRLFLLTRTGENAVELRGLGAFNV